MSFLAQRLSQIKPSPTIAMTTKAAELKQQGSDIISLSAGEPDFPTEPHIIEAAYKAMQAGKTRYTPVEGTVELREAIRGKFLRDNQLEFALNEITVGCGGKQCIYNALLATLDKGDEVIVPTPYWVSYLDITLLCDGAPKLVEGKAENGFKITASQLEAAITKKTKWFIFNSPSNPTGSVYTKEEILSLAEVLKQHPHVWVMTDDIYEHILYDEATFYSFATLAPELRDRILTINGVSKSYAMTGWRLGYAAGPVALIKAMNMVQSQSTTHTSSITQAAATAALNGPQDFIKTNNNIFKQRRDLVCEKLAAIPGLSCPLIPPGAFYVYVSCAGLMGKTTLQGKHLLNDEDVVLYLLEAAGIAAVQGAAFGLSPYFRVSYATATSLLETACTRIAQACINLTDK